MSAKNGLAIGPAFDLGDLSYERRAVTVQRNGEPVELWAWVDGQGCPGYVKARVARARAAYTAATITYPTDDAGEPVLDERGNPVERFQNDPEAWDAYLRDVLLAVVDGLAYSEAEVLAGQMARAMDFLRAHKWVRTNVATEDDDAGETTGEDNPPTTAASSPKSRPSTGSRGKKS